MDVPPTPATSDTRSDSEMDFPLTPATSDTLSASEMDFPLTPSTSDTQILSSSEMDATLTSPASVRSLLFLFWHLFFVGGEGSMTLPSNFRGMFVR